MKHLYTPGPIVACSSCLEGDAAIAVLRLSGFTDLTFLQHILSYPLEKVKARHAFLTKIRDGEAILDEAVGLFFEAPHSYNGESILELSLHGNRLNVERVLSHLLAQTNLRMAHPGEFTYRALVNKKLTLSQVEGLDLLLNAKSFLALEQGQKILQGALQKNFEQLSTLFTKLRVSIELAVDFSEDVGDEESLKLLQESFLALKEAISHLYRRSQGELSTLLSPEVVLLGPVNAGKSSLFNALLGEKRAIVSSVAGTTRDYLSEALFLQGRSFKLLDTAGLRDKGAKAIEKEGILKAKNLSERAFFKILVMNPFANEEEIDEITILEDKSFDLLLLTHGDLLGFEEACKKTLSFLEGKILFKHQISLFCSAGPIGPKLCGPIGPKLYGPIGPKEEIEKIISDKYSQLIKEDPLLIERHRFLVKRLMEVIREFEDLLNYEQDIGILAHEVDHIGLIISELIGVVTPDQVLNNLFSNFCIGK